MLGYQNNLVPYRVLALERSNITSISKTAGYYAAKEGESVDNIVGSIKHDHSSEIPQEGFGIVTAHPINKRGTGVHVEAVTCTSGGDC